MLVECISVIKIQTHFSHVIPLEETTTAKGLHKTHGSRFVRFVLPATQIKIVSKSDFSPTPVIKGKSRQWKKMFMVSIRFGIFSFKPGKAFLSSCEY